MSEDQQSDLQARKRITGCDGHYRKRPSRADSDKLADIIWWIQGALDTSSLGVAFDQSHIEALRRHREYAQFNVQGEWAADDA